MSKRKLRRSDFANVVLNIQNHTHVSRETWKKVAPVAKVKNHDVLAHEWFLNFMPRPNMSIKEERKHLDMRILGKIVGVRSTKQSVWYHL